ncbi:MAG: hypothetical protein IPK19_07905 [Chloroflexi bacterium]|nr:hypothetical protein [Chloroflexota bacterium]
MLRSRLISWGILLAALAVLFHRLLLGEVLFWGLPSLQFIPWRIEAIDLLRAGQLPWWTSLNGAGAPLLANYQSALLYPLNWPGLILPAARMMSLTAVAHLFIAGIGMWTLTGALGIPSLGRGVSTLAFGLSGYLVARAGTFPMVEAAAWLPWLLWMSVRLIEQVTPRRIGWMAIFTALLLLAGHAQTAWYTLLLTGLFTLIVQILQAPRRPFGIAAALAGLLLGLGIAVLQLMGTAELLGQSQRSDGVSFDFAMNLSYAPARGQHTGLPIPLQKRPNLRRFSGAGSLASLDGHRTEHPRRNRRILLVAGPADAAMVDAPVRRGRHRRHPGLWDAAPGAVGDSGGQPARPRGDQRRPAFDGVGISDTFTACPGLAEAFALGSTRPVGAGGRPGLRIMGHQPDDERRFLRSSASRNGDSRLLAAGPA